MKLIWKKCLVLYRSVFPTYITLGNAKDADIEPWHLVVAMRAREIIDFARRVPNS